MPYKDPAKQREYQRIWVAQRRQEWIAEHGPCANCGSHKNLQVDHIDGSGKVTHRVWTWSAARREVELAKCQVLCRTCHSLKTRFEARRMTHGTTTAYVYHGCRCDICRAAFAEKRKNYPSRR